MKRFRLQSACAVCCVVGPAALAQIASVPPGTRQTPPPPRLTNSIMPGTNELPRLQAKKPAEFTSLPPGVYLSKPYTSLVMVPGAVDAGIFQHCPPLPNSPMPVFRPDSKLVPLGQPDK